MDTIRTLLGLFSDPSPIIEWGGLPLIALIVFLETGALVALLPGDSLLVVAGLYAARGTLNVWLLLLIVPLCAIAGDAVSYWIGQKSGPRIFNRPKSRLFNPEHMLAARAFYEKHGGKAIIVARFMPLVRTFVPVVAGVAGMPYRRFALYNVIGGISWVVSMVVVGYLFGQIPLVSRHLEKLIILVVFISILPGIVAWWRNRKQPKPPAGPTSDVAA
jgi:membrane-associated protein